MPLAGSILDGRNAVMAPINELRERIESGGLQGIGADEFRRIGHRGVDLVADYLFSMRERPVFTPMHPDQRERFLDQALPTATRQADGFTARGQGSLNRD
jgi:hypothetical protein